MKDPMKPRLITEEQAATYLGVSRQFLRKSRIDGNRVNHADAPPFIRAGRMIRYSVDDLEGWIAAHREEVR